MLGSEGLGIPPHGSADSWHRTPGSKMGNKPATSSWPPGVDMLLFLLFYLFSSYRISDGLRKNALMKTLRLCFYKLNRAETFNYFSN